MVMKILLKVLDAIHDYVMYGVFKECEEYYMINNPFGDKDE